MPQPFKGMPKLGIAGYALPFVPFEPLRLRFRVDPMIRRRVDESLEISVQSGGTGEDALPRHDEVAVEG